MRRLNSAAFDKHIPSRRLDAAVAGRHLHEGPGILHYANVHSGGAEVYLPSTVGYQLTNGNEALVVVGVHNDLSWLGTGVNLNGILGPTAITVDISRWFWSSKLSVQGSTDPVIVQFPIVEKELVPTGWYLECARWNPVAREFSRSGVRPYDTNRYIDAFGVFKGYRVRCAVDDIDPINLVVASHPMDRSADLRTCVWHETHEREICNKEIGEFEVTGEPELYYSKVFILLLIMILILIVLTVAGFVDDCSNTRWSDNDFITDDERFQPSAKKGCCSGYCARLIFISKSHDRILKTLKAEEQEPRCAHMIVMGLSTHLPMPLEDVKLLLYILRRSALPSSEDAKLNAAPEDVGKPFNGALKRMEAMFPDSISLRNCLDMIVFENRCKLLWPGFLAAHPITVLRQFSIVRHSYMRSMYYSMFLLGAFCVAALYFSLFGQAVLQSAPAECQKDVHIGETVCVALGAVIIAGIFCHVFFTFHHRNVVYISPWTRQREDNIVARWRVCDVILAFIAFGCSFVFIAYTNNFIIKASDNDRDRLFVVCLCILAGEWLIRPALYTVYTICRYGRLEGHIGETRDKCAAVLGIAAYGTTRSVEKAMKEVPEESEVFDANERKVPVTEGDIEEQGPATQGDIEEEALATVADMEETTAAANVIAVSPQDEGTKEEQKMWWEDWLPKITMTADVFEPSATAAIATAVAGSASASSNAPKDKEIPTEVAVVDEEVFVLMKEGPDGTQATLPRAKAKPVGASAPKLARASMDVDGRQVQVIGADRNRDGVPDVLQQDEPLATIGVDTNKDGRVDTFVTGVDRNRDGVPDALQKPTTSGFQPIAKHEERDPQVCLWCGFKSDSPICLRCGMHKEGETSKSSKSGRRSRSAPPTGSLLPSSSLIPSTRSGRTETFV